LADEPAVAADDTPEVFVAYSYNLYQKEFYRKPFKTLEGAFGVRFVFADEKITNQHLLDKVAEMVRRARFSIFDISDWNPNVTLELGLAKGAGRDWYIALNPDKRGEAPADLRGIDRIEYRTFDEFRQQLERVLVGRFPPKLEADPLGVIEARVMEALSDGRARSQAFLVEATGARKDLVGLVLGRLLGRRRIERTGWGAGTRYRTLAALTDFTPTIPPPPSSPAPRANELG
jgi:hypothetical protein